MFKYSSYWSWDMLADVDGGIIISQRWLHSSSWSIIGTSLSGLLQNFDVRDNLWLGSCRITSHSPRVWSCWFLEHIVKFMNAAEHWMLELQRTLWDDILARIFFLKVHWGGILNYCLAVFLSEWRKRCPVCFMPSATFFWKKTSLVLCLAGLLRNNACYAIYNSSVDT